MNRNVESHFSQLPRANIQRSRFDRSQDIKLTGNVGDLIPFYLDEVLPGDTFEITTSKVIRLQTLMTPVMDNLYADFYYFFVPQRLVWDHSKQFYGESDKAWLPTTEYQIPTIGLIDDLVEGDGAVETGDVLDYLGVPVGVSTPIGSEQTFGVSAIPLRSYQKIYDDWFRDENLIDPVNIYTGDTSYKYNWYKTRGFAKPFKVSKFHDYFTSALPDRAKLQSLGDPWSSGSVGVPVYGYGSNIPVVTGVDEIVKPSTVLKWRDINGNVVTTGSGGSFNERRYTAIGTTTEPGVVGHLYSGPDPSSVGVFAYPTNLYTDISANPMLGLFDIVSLRYAFQVQKFYEALARSGSRYTEILEGLFSVKSPDARLQRSEYLGGNRVPVSIHQITNQSQGENDFLGDVGAMSLTTDKHGDVNKSFVEHGYVVGVMCLRYDHSYSQGLERFWFKRNKFDFYWPQFANLSERAILAAEIYLDPDDPGRANDVFGFQEAWSEYRYKPNRLCGEMRPGIPNTLDSWHFGDYYTSMPMLSKEWIEEDKTNVDRCLAVTSKVSNQFFADIYVQNWSTRPMPMYSIPGLADHH